MYWTDVKRYEWSQQSGIPATIITVIFIFYRPRNIANI